MKDNYGRDRGASASRESGLLRVGLGTLLALAAMSGHAAPVNLLYTFEGAPSPAGTAAVDTAGSVIPTELVAGDWTADGPAGLRFSNGNGTDNALGVNIANPSPPNQWADSQTLGFSLTVADGFRLAIDSIGFDWCGSNCGGVGSGYATGWSFTIADATQTYTVSRSSDATGGWQLFDEAIGLGALTGTVNLYFSPNAVLGRQFRIDDFSLAGEVSAVPLPPAILLFGGALVALGSYTRRRA